MPASMLSHLNLRMLVEDKLAQVIWAEKCFEYIYEVSFKFLRGDYKDGYQLWFVRFKPKGGFEPICCSMYQSLETQAINLRREEERSGKSNE
jgi:hypothetical protein